MSKRLVQKSRTGSNSNIEEVGNGQPTTPFWNSVAFSVATAYILTPALMFSKNFSDLRFWQQIW